MRIVMKKSGNSAVARLPQEIIQAARLRIGQLVDIREEAGRIVIEPIHSPEDVLAELLADITPENLHGEAFL